MSDRRWRAKNTVWLILILVLLCCPINWMMMWGEVGVYHNKPYVTRSACEKMNRTISLVLSPPVVIINSVYILAELAE
jgi:hypothetical protein